MIRHQFSLPPYPHPRSLSYLRSAEISVSHLIENHQFVSSLRRNLLQTALWTLEVLKRPYQLVGCFPGSRRLHWIFPSVYPYAGTTTAFANSEHPTLLRIWRWARTVNILRLDASYGQFREALSLLSEYMHSRFHALHGRYLSLPSHLLWLSMSLARFQLKLTRIDTFFLPQSRHVLGDSPRMLIAGYSVVHLKQGISWFLTPFLRQIYRNEALCRVLSWRRFK